MITALIIVLGLAIGSFLNVVIWRLKTKESFLKGRSHCPNCRHQLTAKDLVPLASFLWQKGRCRYCRKKISFIYPLVELAAAMVGLILYLKFGLTLNFFVFWILSWFLIVIFVYDLRYYLIPDEVVIPAIVIGFLGSLLLKLSWVSLGIGVIIGLGFFLIQFIVSRGKWIGGGDLRLGILMGVVLGWPKILLALLIAYIGGAIISMPLLVTKKKTMDSKLPFGPFLVASLLAAIILGGAIINWYLGFYQ